MLSLFILLVIVLTGLWLTIVLRNYFFEGSPMKFIGAIIALVFAIAGSVAMFTLYCGNNISWVHSIFTLSCS